MLRLDGLVLEQGTFRLNADWDVETGTVTTIIGPSGGGKSTLLAAIAGFLPPVSGRVFWDGADITSRAPGDRPVSMLFQDNNLFPHLTVAQNVGLGIAPRLRLTPDQLGRVQGVLAEVGLEGFGDRKPADLSGGQQSRVALARVLLAERPLVLLDEPFSALGPGLRAEMLTLATQTLRRAGRTMVMVTHDPSDAQAVAGQVVLVDGGVAAAPVETESLFATPPEALQRYLGR